MSLDDISVYLVNHTRRSSKKTSLYEALSELEYLNKYIGNHMGDFTWKSDDEIQILDEKTYKMLKKEWKIGGYKLAFLLLKKNCKLFWCCHADGDIQRNEQNDQYSSEEEYYWDRIKLLCQHAKYIYENKCDCDSNISRYGKFWEIYDNYRCKQPNENNLFPFLLSKCANDTDLFI